MIAGVATGAIAHAALVAEKMGLPLLYVRSSEKSHGLGNRIEGDAGVGRTVMVIEDLVSTGSSSLSAVAALKKAGLDVLGMAAIFSYCFPQADENFRKAGVTLHALGNYHTLIEEAAASDYVKPEELGALKRWREDPSGWKTEAT